MRTKPQPSIAAITLCLPWLSGCHGVVWANMAVLAITVGIFMGTLSLGKNG
ncbi:MAG: hypothetical protein OEZ06_22155 [Myxococcales bacterium]|nr:hypothetical protein [Myxococcales bacterium]